MSWYQRHGKYSKESIHFGAKGMKSSIMFLKSTKYALRSLIY